MTNDTPANEFVTDTMGLVLRMEKRKLSQRVRAIFNDVESGDAIVYIPAIVFSEILYLSEKERIDTDLRKALESEQSNSKSLRNQIEWLRLEYERLRKDKKPY